MTKAEKRIRNATLRVIGACATERLKPTDPESDDTRIEYGGGDYFLIEVDGEQYMVTVTANELSDEEKDEEENV